MASKFSKEQTVALNNIAIHGALFPCLVQLLIALLLVLGFFFLYQPGQPLEEKTNALLFMALPVTVFSIWVAAQFAMPRSLFKARKKGQLVAAGQNTHLYVMRWMWLGLGFQLAMALGVGGLNYAGVSVPNMGLLAAFFSAYAANYMVAQRMLEKGDAALKLKSPMEAL
jgi:hypothetical protein